MKKGGYLLFGILCAALLTSPSAASAFALCEGTPCAVILSWSDNPSATQTFSWRDAGGQPECVQVIPQIQYAKTGFSGASVLSARCSDISQDGSGAWHYEVTATGLTANTAYVYRVGSDGNWSEARNFTTADPDGKNLSFVYMGDVQPETDIEEEFADWGALAKAAYTRNPEIAFGLLGGDIVSNGTSLREFDCFLENAESVFADVPLMATNGNHESNFAGTGKPELYLNVFAFPENGPDGFKEEFYSFDYANCHVLVLNSWIYSGEQKLTDSDYAAVNTWIANDLATSTADWQIVVTHVPVYALHSDTTAAALKENWAPIFEKYGVDLVLVGHQHVYSRSYPMYGGRVDYANGITYIMGDAGQKFYGSADETFSARTIYDTATYQLVRIDGDSLTVQTFDAGGEELDFCTVMQRAYVPGFSDVAAGSWYAGYVDCVMGQGLFDITGPDTFGPDEPMTRAMLAEALYRLAGSPAVSAAAPFADVPDSASYADAVAWTFGNGVVNGTSETAFSPDGSITREQMAAMFYRYAVNFAGRDISAAGDLSAFSDGNSVSGWAADSMRWMVGAGLVNGTDAAALMPQGTLTRAQAAAVLTRFMEGDVAA